MTFIRIYSLSVTEGQGVALETALSELAAALMLVEGCDRLLICRDRGAIGDYTVIEFWRTAEHHAASAASLPKSCFAAIMRTLCRPPVMKEIDQLWAR